METPLKIRGRKYLTDAGAEAEGRAAAAAAAAAAVYALFFSSDRAERRLFLDPVPESRTQLLISSSRLELLCLLSDSEINWALHLFVLFISDGIEIIKRITKTSDLNSLSLVSKQLYNAEAEERGTICIGCSLRPATEALSSLCLRFPNLWKIEINYSGWTSKRGMQLDSQGILVLSSQCPLLTDLTLSFCSYINDTGVGYLAHCKKLMALRLNFAPAISSSGLLSVVVGCKSLSTFHLIDCMKVGSVEWLEYLGRNGSVVELVVKDCKGISQFDLLKFGPGWMKLEKYDIRCENLKELRLAHIITVPEIGLRFLLRKCKSLQKLSLDYVVGLDERELIALLQNCSNLRSLTLRLMPLWCGPDFKTPLTDESLMVLGLSCPMLEAVELTFTFSMHPSEIGFTQEGILMLAQSCPIRVLVLNGAGNFYDEGMKGLSSAQFLETLELADCECITDAGMSYITRTPSLSNLILRQCKKLTDNGMNELARSQKLESLTVVGCQRISLKAVQGAASEVSVRVIHKGRIRDLILNGANIFSDEFMAVFELVDSKRISLKCTARETATIEDSTTLERPPARPVQWSHSSAQSNTA
ncbi:hypothetical protein U9M48_021597 [Paspalum notatum var. saurae]|uniref:F-box/LRR-repeat protein 15-like leucin rich repeat domain-containing protein n=1 Tax=Paspalum notatum var. saurae TaxID=547442 RepID=A0AAQ3WTX8_PASNO